MKQDILGVKVDQVNMKEAVSLVLAWIKNSSSPKYIVTPNVEFIMAAQTDLEFKNILNKADLGIADSARLGWAREIICEKNFVKKLLKWPFFLMPKILVNNFDTVAGVDLTERLIKQSADQGFTVGFLGGQKTVADRLVKVLKGQYPGLKVSFVSDGGEVDWDGQVVGDGKLNNISNTDLLFVAFGQIKQEKWISKNLAKYPVKVMMGVGGAFDYLSGSIPRAPKLLRSLGLEWLFRLMVQPWRIKRFGSLIQFIFLVLK